MVTEESVQVEFGSSPSFSCSLPNAAGVKQVTWQQLVHNDALHTIATFSENFRQQVTDKYLGKVEVTEAMLNATTIVIKNVTFEDTACYICTFNVYPSGTERRKTCLSVHGLSNMTTNVLHDSAGKQVFVSCSATGKPTPVISWESIDMESVQNFTRSVTGDGPFTTTNNFTLALSLFKEKTVTCVAQSGDVSRSQVINVRRDEEPKGSGMTSRHYFASFLVVFICILLAVFGVVVYRRKKSKEYTKHSVEIMA
ncbi:OX-2 membrane glycoprotein-like isoform X2 [Hoplias malabaricus]